MIKEAVTFGPKMQAPNERQQKFVVALFTKGMPPKGSGRHTLAARVAGYGNKQGTSSAEYFTVISSQLLANPKIQAAIEEYARGAVRAMAPDAVVAVLGLLEDRKHRDHAKVALAVMEKFDPTPRGSLVQIENHNTNVTVGGDAAIERIKELCAKHGFDADALLGGRQTPALLELRALRDEGTASWSWRAAVRQAVAVWTVALVLAGLAALLAFAVTAHAQARLDNLVSGSASATGTSQTTIIAAPPGTRVNYITAVQCGRSDTGTSAIFVTFNDDASTIMVLPNSGGGGANNLTFPNPLMVAGAFKFTASAGVKTLYCNAQGYTGN